MTTADHLIISKLKQGDTSALDEVYRRYRQDFMGWLMHKHHCSRDEAAELYQASVLIFHENVLAGKLQELTSSLKSYLFAVGRNKLQELRREKSRNIELLEEYLYEHIELPDGDSREEYRLMLDLVVKSLEELGDPCKSLLESFYYGDLSMKEIAQEMDYKNPNTTKNQKYKCLLRLRTIFQAALGKMRQ